MLQNDIKWQNKCYGKHVKLQQLKLQEKKNKLQKCKTIHEYGECFKHKDV